MTYEPKWDDVFAAKVLDVADVVKLEQSIAATGTSLDELMQRAGACAADFVRRCVPAGARIVVFCGSGNNGGDGWVAAQLLAQAGYQVRLITPCAAEEVPAHPAAEAAVRCMQAVGELRNFHLAVAPERQAIDGWLAEADVAVDALLGTGFHYPSLREPVRTYVEALAAVVGAQGSAPAAPGKRPRIVAIDVPSGLNAQTGTATDPVVSADDTMCMMTLKTGMLKPQASALCGELHVARIADFSAFL